MSYVVIVDEFVPITAGSFDALTDAGFIVDYKTKEDDMFNSRIALVTALSGFAAAAASSVDALTQIAVANSNMSSFATRYGNNPRSMNGSHARNSNAAAQKRAARKLRNIRAKSSKRA